MSQQSSPSSADETRIATEIDQAPASDPAATRIVVDMDRPGPPPGFDPAATRIGTKELLAVVRKPGAPEPVERWKIGDRIAGAYEVLAIHRGAMGVVYATFNHKRHAPRALKMIQDRFAANARLREAFAAEASIWVSHPLAAWENWLALREAVDDLEQRLGQDALNTLWYSRIRDRIWSWAYREWTERSEQSGWAMSIVFDWIADWADVLGDLPAAAINRENARVARIAA